jgi:signal transduction histidine kinase
MGPRTAEIRGRRKDGSEFPADATISKLTVGDTTILTVVLRDVTEQKRIESEQRFLAQVGSAFASTLEYAETLTAVAHLAVHGLADLCVVDIVEDNGETRRPKALSRDPSKAWVCDLLVEGPLDRARSRWTSSVVETQEPVLIENVTPEIVTSWAESEEHLRAIRAVHFRSLLVVPLVAYGKVLGSLFLASSTPEQVYGAADLRLAKDFAHRAALSIENARLYRTARRAVQARDEVLGIVAHDLRNPLSTVLLQATTLRRRTQEREAPARKSAEAIERAASRMNRLIQDLLDVTRAEAGRLSLEAVCLQAAQVASDAMEAQKSIVASASIELRLDAAPNVSDIKADRNRLLQVFENLVGNAVKFTESGGSITIGAAPKDHEVVFWVADTGAGIPGEDLPHVFDRFWQARKTRRGGAGLGLPIVKGIVEAHGGRIWVESTLGRGSTFFFTIPAAPPAGNRP